MKATITKIAEALQQSKSLYVQIDYIADMLNKYIGRMVETSDGRYGHITNFDFETAELVVEFGLKTGKDYGIKFYSCEELINGELKLCL